jgi:hypothetical protein
LKTAGSSKHIEANHFLKNRKTYFAALVFLFLVLSSKTILAEVNGIYDESSDEIAGINSLMSAVASNDINGVRFFSKAGRALVNQKNFGGATALHMACREDNFAIAKILVENGADVNAIDNEGWTPLMRASLAGNENIVMMLLNNGATGNNLNSVNESAIVHAALSDCNECLSLMFERFNFVKNMDVKLLKEQLSDAFIIARNHDNEVAQGILESYLDKVIKTSPLVSLQEVPPPANQVSRAVVGENKVFKIADENKSVQMGAATPIQQADSDEENVKPKIVKKIVGRKKPKMVLVHANPPAKAHPRKSKIKHVHKFKKNKNGIVATAPVENSIREQKIYKFMGYCKCNKDNGASKIKMKKSSLHKKPKETIVLIKKHKASSVYKFKHGKLAKKKKAAVKKQIEDKAQDKTGQVEPKPEAVVTPVNKPVENVSAVNQVSTKPATEAPAQAQPQQQASPSPAVPAIPPLPAPVVASDQPQKDQTQIKAPETILKSNEIKKSIIVE